MGAMDKFYSYIQSEIWVEISNAYLLVGIVDLGKTSEKARQRVLGPQLCIPVITHIICKLQFAKLFTIMKLIELSIIVKLNFR